MLNGVGKPASEVAVNIPRASEQGVRGMIQAQSTHTWNDTGSVNMPYQPALYLFNGGVT